MFSRTPRTIMVIVALAAITGITACDRASDPAGLEPEAPATELEAAYASARTAALATASSPGEWEYDAGAGSDRDGTRLHAVGPSATGIFNGSFETGDFSGWTTIATGPQFQPWSVDTGGAGGGFGMAATSPPDGTFDAWNGFDGGGPMEFVTYQDVDIGMGLPTLTWQERIQWNFGLGGVATQPRTATLQALDISAPQGPDTLYLFSTGTQSDGVTGDTGWQTRTVDLSAYRGQTVRIAFVQSIPQLFTGPGQYELDAVTLDRNGTGAARLLSSAQVLNPGESTGVGSCRFAGRTASRATFVRTPRGGGTLSCHWDDFSFAGELDRAIVIQDRTCFLRFGGLQTVTERSHFVLSPNRTAKFTCQFENVV